MKTEVYSWRVEPELKSSLETAARERETSVARLLDRIVGEWLAHETTLLDDGEMQARLHEEAERCFGTLRGGDPDLASEASQRVKRRLRERHAARRPD